MYKARIREWKMEKKTKGTEMEVIIRKQAERSRVGKRSAFSVRNKVVPPGKIERYRKNKKIGTHTKALKLRSNTPPGLACWTPPASPLTTPREFAVPERLAKLTQEWIDGSLGSDAWRAHTSNWSISSANLDTLDTFDDGCIHASRILRHGNTNYGMQLLDCALSLIPRILPNNNPHTLCTIVEVLEGCHWHVGGMTNTILGRLLAGSLACLGAGHPLTEIFAQPIGGDGDYLRYSLGIMLSAQNDSFMDRLGPFHIATLDTASARLRLKGKEKNYTTAHAFLQLIQTCDEVLGAGSLQSQMVRIKLSFYLHRRGETADAAEMLQKHINMARELNIAVGSNTWYAAALAHDWLSQFDIAEKYMRRAILVRSRLRSWQDPRVIGWLRTLEKWLIRWNRPEEAANVRSLWLGNVDFASMQPVDVSIDQ